MIKELFDKMEIHCGNKEEHPEEAPVLEATDINGRGYVFYCCPKCLNRISMPDLERMVDKIDKMMSEDSHQGMLPTDMNDLTNASWKTRRGIEYKVLSHDWFSGHISVTAYNPMEIAEQRARTQFAQDTIKRQSK